MNIRVGKKFILGENDSHSNLGPALSSRKGSATLILSQKDEPY